MPIASQRAVVAVDERGKMYTAGTVLSSTTSQQQHTAGLEDPLQSTHTVVTALQWRESPCGHCAVGGESADSVVVRLP